MRKRTIDWTTRVEAGQDLGNQTALHMIGVWFGLVAPIGPTLVAIWSLIIVGQSN